MNIEKITQGKNLTDTERTVLEYILDHLDTVQTEGVRGVARANSPPLPLCGWRAR